MDRYLIPLLLAIVTLGAGALFFTTQPASALQAEDGGQPATPYKVVFQVTSETPKAWGGVLRNIDNLRESLGKENVTVEVVGHSGGLGMLTKSNTDTGEKVQELAKDGVTFLACENTMSRKDISRDQLLPGIDTVDAGVAQVVRRQAEGWQYIRNGN